MADVRNPHGKAEPTPSAVEAAGLAALLNLDGHLAWWAKQSVARARSDVADVPTLPAVPAASAAPSTPALAVAQGTAPAPLDGLRSLASDSTADAAGLAAPAPRFHPKLRSLPVLATVEAQETELGRIGAFVLREQVQHGGMGRLFKAWDAAEHVEVAVTVLDIDDEALNRDAIIARLHESMRAAAPLVHEGLARIVDAGVVGEGVYIVTEWLNGTTLAQSIRAAEPASAMAVATMAAELADALAHVHARGVIHGGLNPANVVLDAHRRPKIIGLGFACAAHASNLPYMDPLVTGAAPYLAPEQLQGAGLDERTDVHALGVMLYEMLAGRRAYPGQTVPEIAHALIHHDPTPPHWLAASVPERLSTIAMQALQRNPAARFARAADMATELRRWMADAKRSAELAPPAPTGAAALLGAGAAASAKSVTSVTQLVAKASKGVAGALARGSDRLKSVWS